MDLAFLERLIDLVGQGSISELELVRDGWRVRIVKRDAAPSDPQAPAVAAVEPAAPDHVAPSPPAADARHVIRAGTVGLFHRAPGPGQPAFVAVGDAVAEGQTLGILEAMKTFIPVESDRDGQVDAVLQDNGAAVRTGDPLFAIAPADRS